MKKRIALIIACILCLTVCSGVYAYTPFPENNITAVFLGGSNILQGNIKDMICGYIESEYEKKVSVTDLSENNITSQRELERLAEITAEKPDIVFLEVPAANEESGNVKRNTELLVRGIFEADRDTVIVFMVMPKESGDNSAVLEVAGFYGAGIYNFEQYFNRRIEAGVLKSTDILTGNVLNDKGFEMIESCVKDFYKTSQYKKAVYKEKSLTGAYNTDTEPPDEPGNQDNPAVNEGYTKEEAMALLEDAVIVSVYSNKALIGGEVVPIDVKDSSSKPALFAGQLSLPVRFLKDYLNCKIKYNTETGGITLSGEAKSVSVNFYDNKAISDGSEIYVAYPAVMYNSATYIPEEIVSIVTGKTIFSKDGCGVICGSAELTQQQRETVIECAQEILRGKML